MYGRHYVHGAAYAGGSTLVEQVASVLELVGGALFIGWFRGRDIL